MRDVNEQLHDGGEEKADGPHPQNGPEAEGPEQRAPDHRPQQGRQGVHHVDDGVGAGEPLRVRQKGDAGLHRRLIGPGGAVQQHEADGRQRDQGRPPQEEGEEQNQPRRGEVQKDHDVPLVHPVRRHAADGGAQHRRDKRRRPHRAEQGRGPGLPQEVQRQGEAQNGAAEEGDDLPHHHQGKVPAE